VAGRIDPAQSTVDRKAHLGPINAFGKHRVLGGPINQATSRSIDRVHSVRQTADYVGDLPYLKDATWVV
jgi:uncharacterized protein (UPF0332 family)